MKFCFKIATVLLLAIVSSLSALALTVGYEPAANSAANAATMEAVSYHCYGPPAVLKYSDIPRPEPGDTELLVKVASASIYPLDWHYMRGSPYLMRLMTGIGAPQDSRLGVDFADTVEAVGNAVATFKVGDRVYGGTDGAFAEYLTVDQSKSVSTVPDNISLAQAASVPIAGVSALQALRDKGYLSLLARSFTATGKSPEQIHEIGKAKVARILAEMEPVKDSLKFEGGLNAFNNFLRTDR